MVASTCATLHVGDKCNSANGINDQFFGKIDDVMVGPMQSTRILRVPHLHPRTLTWFQRGLLSINKKRVSSWRYVVVWDKLLSSEEIGRVYARGTA